MGYHTLARIRRAPEHYVNNRLFSEACDEYVQTSRVAVDDGKDKPEIPAYIVSSFMKISEGLSHKDNFINYTYRDDMVMDGVENCLRAIGNYTITAETRSGKPNAFGYFTKTCFNAFLRRIKKEKAYGKVKDKLIIRSSFVGIGEGIVNTHVDIYGAPVYIPQDSKMVKDAYYRDDANTPKSNPKPTEAVEEIPTKNIEGYLDKFKSEE